MAQVHLQQGATAPVLGPRSFAHPGEGGPSSRCELGEEGGVWGTGARGRALFVPVAKENGG